MPSLVRASEFGGTSILCVSHTGEVSGAERSLLELIAELQRQEVTVRLACPSSGPLAGAARGLGVAVCEIGGTAGSLKLHPRETPLAVGQLGVAGLLTARHARRMRAQVIHANSIRAGLLAIPAARLTGIGIVVHVRDRLPRSPVADASLRLVAAGADVMVANSSYTANAVREVAARGRIETIYNPVDLERYRSARVDRDGIRAKLGLGPDSFVLAIVGQITPWKGQREAVEILTRLLRLGHDVELLVVGEAKFVSSATRYDNRAYHAEVLLCTTAEGVAQHVHWLGERADVPDIMGCADVLMVPSWAEPFGRVVVEAMGLGTPVIATSVGGPSEIIHNNRDGILLPPRQPERWAEVVAHLIESPDLRAELGGAAVERARDFSVARHVAAMREIYDEVAAARLDAKRGLAKRAK